MPRCCQYEVKYNNARVGKIDALWKDMLDLCWQRLQLRGYTRHLEVTFQRGPSQRARGRLGEYYDRVADGKDCIIIYTYRRRMRTILGTIAHEFGHAEHCHCVAGGDRWPSEDEERYAEEVSSIMLKVFDEYCQRELQALSA